jgi:hypothetical protein
MATRCTSSRLAERSGNTPFTSTKTAQQAPKMLNPQGNQSMLLDGSVPRRRYIHPPQKGSAFGMQGPLGHAEGEAG